MSDTNQHNPTTEKAKGRELTRRYLEIVKLKVRIQADIKRLISLCMDFAPMFDDVRDGNASRLGWWLGQYAPAVANRQARVFNSIASRTKSADVVESWQIRLLGLVSSVHHKDKPIVEGRSKRRFKEKSWIYHVSKVEDNLTGQIKRMGGIKSLTKEEKAHLLEQFSSMRGLIDDLTD